jgi:ATP-dependent Clp protease ATP-binding subunit ClpC
MAERELQLELTGEAKDMLVEKGWDPAMGARPLRRAIQRYVEDPLADFVLREELVPGATVVIDPSPKDEEGEVRLSVVKPKRQKTPVGVGAEGPSPEAELTELTEGEGRPEDDHPEDDRPELGDPREQ